MVTFFVFWKRRVSIWARMAVSWPGFKKVWSACAVVQPQETRTLVMWTGEFVLLTRRNGCVRICPRGTEPKSRESSSNMPSAHEEAEAWFASPRRAAQSKLYRNILPLPCCVDPDTSCRRSAARDRDGHDGGPSNL